MKNREFFGEFGSELLVLNGLDYSVNSHFPCSRYMATGKLDSLAYPTFAALVAACKGPKCPLSFLTFGNYSATGNLVAMSRVPYLQSLTRIANADAIDGNTLIRRTTMSLPWTASNGGSASNGTTASHSHCCLASKTAPRTCFTLLSSNSKSTRPRNAAYSTSDSQAKTLQQAEVALASFATVKESA